MQAAMQRGKEAEARAHAASSTAADLQQHVTWQEGRIKELESQVPSPLPISLPSLSLSFSLSLSPAPCVPLVTGCWGQG